jgi:hypothetical protein
MDEPKLMIAMRATDPRICHPVATLRRPCSRCGEVCGITPASLDAVEAQGLSVVCTQCLTTEEVLAMQTVTITQAQLDEVKRYQAGLQ